MYVPKNLRALPMRVLHAELQRDEHDRGSIYRSVCPACHDGLLLVSRNQQALLELHRTDRCTSCGQRVWYLDALGPRGEVFSEPPEQFWS